MLKTGMMIAERYEILGKIGTGGMAEVYKAKDHKLNRFVAVKILKQEFREDTTFIKKFKSEAQAAAGLTHPNIVNVFDVGEDEGIHYIVMELIDGITLKEYISKKGKLSIKEATSIAIQVSMGLEAAHNHKIVHRDVKPQNIIISTDGKVKVTDFGIARGANSNTISSNVMGSVHYSSPEQVRGGYSDEKSDIYSLGITIYEMVTGRVPFDGESTVAIAIKHLQEEMVPPSAYAPELPFSLEQIITKCTQKSVDRRYNNMEEVIADLKHSLIDPQGTFVKMDPPAGGSTHTFTEQDLRDIRSTSKKDYSQDEQAPEAEKPGENAKTRSRLPGKLPFFGRGKSKESAPEDAGDKKNTGRSLPDDEAGASYKEGDEGSQGEGDAASGAQDWRASSEKREEGASSSGKAGQSYDVKEASYKEASYKEASYKDASYKDASYQERGGDNGNGEGQRAQKKAKKNTAADGTDAGRHLRQPVSRSVTILFLVLGALILLAAIFFIGKAAGLIQIGDVDAVPQPSGQDTTATARSTEMMVEVPNLVGYTEEEALNYVKDMHIGIQMGSEEASSLAQGLISSQSPAAGTQAAEYSIISYNISKGSADIEVPSTAGLKDYEAKKLLEDLGLNVDMQKAYSPLDDDGFAYFDPGYVYYTDPEEGETLHVGDTITLVISRGKDWGEYAEVPDVVNMTLDEALVSLGKWIDVRTEEQASDTVPAGTVIAQSLDGGEIADPDNPITLTVSSGSQAGTAGGGIIEETAAANSEPSSAPAEVWRCTQRISNPEGYQGGAIRLELHQQVNGAETSVTVLEGQTIAFPYQLNLVGAEGVASGTLYLSELVNGTYVELGHYPITFVKE